RAPAAGAAEEAHLPVVDVEQQRPPAAAPRQQGDAVAGRARLARVEHVAVGLRGQRGPAPGEAGIAAGAVHCERAMSDRAAERRAPQAFAEAGTDDLDVGRRPAARYSKTTRDMPSDSSGT